MPRAESEIKSRARFQLLSVNAKPRKERIIAADPWLSRRGSQVGNLATKDSATSELLVYR